MDHTTTDNTEVQVIEGWVQTTRTIITWQEQPDQIQDLLISLSDTQAQEADILQKLSDLGYEGE